MNANTLIELHDVGKSFRAADGTARHVLEHVDFILHEGEIVALLGKSGSGKSTLLRIMAGLVNADQGTVMYRGQPVYGPAAGISMVFQSFALFPWLTAQQNVELGLEAQGVAPAERARRADEVLDLIGLGGFGGRCRASCPAACASAWASPGAGDEPDVLLMDEAFSALDVLTGETLRDDMLELWDESRISTKGILIVSHNIEEAVMMADRIIVFASDPGRIRSQVQIGCPGRATRIRPRCGR